MIDIENIINEAFENRGNISLNTKGSIREAVDETLNQFDLTSVQSQSHRQLICSALHLYGQLSALDWSVATLGRCHNVCCQEIPNFVTHGLVQRHPTQSHQRFLSV